MDQVKSEIRYCEDIGMWSSDREIKSSCKWRTSFCKFCYNQKTLKRFPKAMATKDERNEAYWAILDGERLRKDLKSKKKGSSNRFRFQTRGETFATVADFWKVLEIVTSNPKIDFWIPTRAWRNDELRFKLEAFMMKMPNVFLLASTDPTNSAEEWKSLKTSGWSVMFYGDNDMIQTPAGDRLHSCSKTFFDENGACATCKDGCFSKNQVVVHLKKH